MQFYADCLTREILPNWRILSCHFCLLCWPLSAQSSEVPLDVILPCCFWMTRSTLPMGWCSLLKALVDPVVVHTLKMSKPLQSAFSDGVWEHIFICDMLWPHNLQDLSLASHIKGVQSGLISFSQAPALSSMQHTRALKGHTSCKTSFWCLVWDVGLSKHSPTLWMPLLLCQFYCSLINQCIQCITCCYRNKTCNTKLD